MVLIQNPCSPTTKCWKSFQFVDLGPRRVLGRHPKTCEKWKKSPERLLVHMDFSCEELGVRTLEFFHKNNHSPLGNELLRMADICTIYGCEEMCSFVHVGAPLTDTACMDSRVRFWGHNPWHAPVGMLVMGEAGASTRAKRWHAGTQRPGQTPVVSSEAWMEVLAFLFWFGWRGGGPACASLTPLLGLLLCPPLLARVAVGEPRPFLLYGASNCWFLGRRPLNPETRTNASSFFGGLDGSLGFSLLVWVAGRWCPLCLFNPSVGSPPLSSSFGPVAAGGPRPFLLYGASNCWFLGRRPLNPETRTNASSFFGGLDGSLGFSLLVWVAGRWSRLCLFNPSVGSSSLSSSFGPGGGWRAQALPIIWRLKLLIFGAPAPEPRDPDKRQ